MVQQLSPREHQWSISRKIQQRGARERLVLGWLERNTLSYEDSRNENSTKSLSININIARRGGGGEG